MLTIGVVQFNPQRADPVANLRAVEHLLSSAGSLQADLLVLPELANSGYLYASTPDLAHYAEPGDASGPFLGGLVELAKSTGGVIVTGFAENAGGELYNSAAAVSSTGVLQVYRKTHLFADEQDLFLPGNSGFGVFEHNGARIGMMICFDWAFPEAARSLTLNGAQIIAHPSNLVLQYCQQAMLTRSLENGVFSITCNRWGEETLGETHLRFTGGSQIVSQRGVRLAQSPEGDDAVQIVTIDPAEADDKWITPRNHRLKDRRPEMYRS